MEANDDTEPALVQMGAGTDDSVRDINLDVSGTVGPDSLGQETTTVDGHWADRPGVQWRRPEEDPDDPRIRRMDTGEELPVLLSSSMSAGPVEGVQGTYTHIIEGECPRCGYDRLRVTVQTLAGERKEVCNACGAKADRSLDRRYRMPQTDEERAERERESGERLADLSTRVAVDMESDTGMGPYVSLVGSRSVCRLRKDDVRDLFFALVNRNDIDFVEAIRQNDTQIERAYLALAILPDGMGITEAGDE